MILSRFQKKFKNISISQKAENEKEKIEMKKEKTKIKIRNKWDGTVLTLGSPESGQLRIQGLGRRV